MKILSMEDGFADTREARAKQWFDELSKHVGKPALFKGVGEVGPFKKGWIRDVTGDTITFINDHDEASSDENWTYPFRAVIIAV
jgi:hypothetical protein